jgi:hypothetical protein
VLIGIEDNKPEAISAAMEAARHATAGDRCQVVAVPTRYPAGGAKQLIRVLTGIEVPHGERSTDFGVQCFNVGTAYAIHEAIEHGQPTDLAHRHGGRQCRPGAQLRGAVRHPDARPDGLVQTAAPTPTASSWAAR